MAEKVRTMVQVTVVRRRTVKVEVEHAPSEDPTDLNHEAEVAAIETADALGWDTEFEEGVVFEEEGG